MIKNIFSILVGLLLVSGCESVTIPAEIQAPITNNDSVEVEKTKSIIISILNNDTDSDGSIDKSSVKIITDVKHGKTTLDTSKGTVTYVSEANFIGTDTFTYQVKDNNGALSNIATVTIQVKEETSTTPAPVAHNDSKELTVATSIVIDVLANDTISMGTIDKKSLIIIKRPTYGSIFSSAINGTITYIANNTFVGKDSFTYKVKSDKGILSNEATVLLTVKSQANKVSFATNGEATVEINVTTIEPKIDKIEEKAKEWYVRLVVEDTTNNMKTATTQLGQLEGTDVVNKHSLKALAPFRPTYLDVVFKNPEGIAAGEYKSNFHTASAEVDSWEFTVKSHDSNATMILSWRGLYVLSSYTDTEGRKQYREYISLTNPLLSHMVLVDTVTNEVFNIIKNEEVQTYVFHMNGNTQRTFRWELKDGLIPSSRSPEAKSSPQIYQEKLKKLEVKVLRKDAKATPNINKKKRIDSMDLLMPPIFEVLVK